MKALVYKGPKNIAVEQKPIPKVCQNEVLVKVSACGICGSDTHGYLGGTGRRYEGYCMGHECCGKVAELGPGVNGWHIGDRVVIQPTFFCGTCEYCRQGKTELCMHKGFLGVFDVEGAMAEYVKVPEKVLYRMPENMTYMEGALIEPLAVAKCAVDKIPYALDQKSVLVVGVGTIGLLIVSVLKARGVKNIIASDLSANRLAFAKKMGADHVFDPSKADIVAAVREATGGMGADVSFEAVGADKPVQTAIDCLKLGGDCVWVGNSKKNIVLDMQSVVTREITVYGTYTYSHAEFGNTLYQMADMGIPVETLVGKCISIEQAPEMFEYLADGNDNLVKALIIF